MRTDDLGPLRVLVVEDEFLIAMQLEEDLSSANCVVVGCYASLQSALEGARRDRFDIAILDINLNGEFVFPLADELTARGLPFIFLSGYGASVLPDRLRSAPRVAKPLDPEILIAEMRRILAKPD